MGPFGCDYRKCGWLGKVYRPSASWSGKFGRYSRAAGQQAARALHVGALRAKWACTWAASSVGVVNDGSAEERAEVAGGPDGTGRSCIVQRLRQG